MIKTTTMNFKKILPIFVLFIAIQACASGNTNDTNTAYKPKPKKSLDDYSVAYFASGCFWCVEAVFEAVKGVEEAVSGYAGGDASDATYSKVSSGVTNHAEAVAVYYDPEVISYETLLVVFFDSHDPTTLNRQGPDYGRQYRSAIYYTSEDEKKIATAYINALLNDKKFKQITTEVVPFEAFYEAEDYHQDYKLKNPDNSYVKAVSNPRFESFAKKHPGLLKGK
jgi:peptide-methionine (S)-S-oxide reductase